MLILFFFCAALNATVSFNPLSSVWPWEQLAIKELQFPKDFVFGTAICEFQNSGDACQQSTWHDWQASTFADGKPHIREHARCGRACDHWNSYRDDIKLMKKLGMSAFRFSVDWATIEPTPGDFNQEAVKHYHDLVDALLAAQITPMITLHHFNLPSWFEKKGGFERKKNIDYFVRFCSRVFQELQDKVQLWCTINEPSVYVAQGYLRGVFPPGKQQPLLACQVLKNLMIAHVEVYKELKKHDRSQKSKIGIAHQHLLAESYSYKSRPYHLPALVVESAAARLLNAMFFSETLVSFFATGKLSFDLPVLSALEYTVPRHQPFLDYIGLNYYSHVVIQSQWDRQEPAFPGHHPEEIMTDMQYPLYAEGLYHAIDAVSSIGVPIYITENGIADHKDDRRKLFIKRYLYALSRAIADGYDVRGYFYWTLMDNFEWDEGYHPKFGLYAVDFATNKRTLRDGARYYQKVARKNSDRHSP